MTGALALLMLATTLGFAVARPRGLPEVAAALPAAALVVGTGALGARPALDEVRSLAPTVAFLGGVLVIAALSDAAGLFAAGGRLMARVAAGRPVRLLALVFAVAAAVTVTLSLDATVVLLTPVVYATAATLRLRARPHVYACVHLANSASLLLPVSNLTNLIAWHRSGLSFLDFGAVMALPWGVAIAGEWLVLRRFFGDQLGGRGAVAAASAPARLPPWPLAVIGLTLAGFAATSPLGLDPAYVAGGGALLLAVPALVRRRTTVRQVAGYIDVPFLAFVLALGVVVAAATANGLGAAVGHLVPDGAGLPELLAVAAMAALLANLVNNLPAILIMLPLVAPHGTGPVLAALVGVNLGPNLTYVGSLATLLWRASLRARGVEPAPVEFLRLGALTVPLTLVASTSALWAVLQLR